MSKTTIIRRLTILIILIILFLIVISAIVGPYILSGRTYKLKDSAIKYLMENIGVNGNTSVQLPEKYKKLSVDGIVYITDKNAYKLYVFREYLGRGGDFAGSLYSDSKIFNKGQKLDVYTYMPYRNTGYLKVTITCKENDHWYDVSTDFMN